jgi:hypothetical protein
MSVTSDDGKVSWLLTLLTLGINNVHLSKFSETHFKLLVPFMWVTYFQNVHPILLEIMHVSYIQDREAGTQPLSCVS